MKIEHACCLSASKCWGIAYCFLRWRRSEKIKSAGKSYIVMILPFKSPFGIRKSAISSNSFKRMFCLRSKSGSASESHVVPASRVRFISIALPPSQQPCQIRGSSRQFSAHFTPAYPHSTRTSIHHHRHRHRHQHHKTSNRDQFYSGIWQMIFFPTVSWNSLKNMFSSTLSFSSSKFMRMRLVILDGKWIMFFCMLLV